MKQIFVFGSNTQGAHGAGAALTARRLHGAIYGVPMGLQGNAYGIITKHLPKGERSVPLHYIHQQVNALFEFATIRRDLVFLITRIGCGHAGFTEDEIAPMFRSFTKLDNIKLCKEFEIWLEAHK